MSHAASDSDLGELLVLMLRAHRSFRTLRAEVRVWRHHERSQEAFTRRNEERRDGASMTMIAFSLSEGDEDAAPAPSESEDCIRLWLALPDRLREEAVSGWTGERVESLLVKVADTWWSFDPRVGATTNGGSLRHGHGTQIDSAMLDPAQLSASHEFRILGRTMHAGRHAIRVEARPSPRAEVFPESGPGAWPQELLVDAERGVLLRSASLLDGEPFAVSEVLSVAFDETLPDELFVFEAPRGRRSATRWRTWRRSIGRCRCTRPPPRLRSASSFPARFPPIGRCGSSCVQAPSAEAGRPV